MNTIKPEKKHLANDLLAGLTFALVNIPQSMAHALLATVNPVFGLYTLMLAMPVGALLTSAVFMNVSTTSALAVAAGDTLITYPSSGRESVLVTLVLLIGVFQITLGLLRLGWVTRFIPFSVMTGFMTGVAVLIIFGQLGDFTGYYSAYSAKLLQLADLVLNRESIEWATLAIAPRRARTTALPAVTPVRASPRWTPTPRSGSTWPKGECEKMGGKTAAAK